MGLHEDISKLLKADGMRMNEAIRSALDEFIDTVKIENEDFEEDEDAAEDDEESEE
jgi:hypothetical protein